MNFRNVFAKFMKVGGFPDRGPRYLRYNKNKIQISSNRLGLMIKEINVHYLLQKTNCKKYIRIQISRKKIQKWNCNNNIIIRKTHSFYSVMSISAILNQVLEKDSLLTRRKRKCYFLNASNKVLFNLSNQSRYLKLLKPKKYRLYSNTTENHIHLKHQKDLRKSNLSGSTHAQCVQKDLMTLELMAII